MPLSVAWTFATAASTTSTSLERPSQDLLVIRRNHQTGQVLLDPLRWGLISYGARIPKGGRKPINAKWEMVSTLPTFRDAYRRRCIVPLDVFLRVESRIGQKAKQPYAIAMKDGQQARLAPLLRAVQAHGHIRVTPILGGLHHQYGRI